MFRNSFESFNDEAVCTVNDGCVYACKVDLGGCFAVVAHAFQDYRERDAFCFGGSGPAMVGNVKGQRDRSYYHYGDMFQIVVNVVADVSVGSSLVNSGVADDRKQIVAFVFGIFVENHLHFLASRPHA